MASGQTNEDVGEGNDQFQMKKSEGIPPDEVRSASGGWKLAGRPIGHWWFVIPSFFVVRPSSF
jgi:hypothetical protein